MSEITGWSLVMMQLITALGARAEMSGTGAQGWAANINRSHADNGSGY